MTVTIERTEAQRCVQAGEAFLDEHRTDDWTRLIDRDRLDISNACDCVLGQLYGDYYTAVREMPGLSYFKADGLGFDSHSPGPSDAELTAEWRRVIMERTS